MGQTFIWDALSAYFRADSRPYTLLVLRVRTIPQRHGDELLRRATLYGTPHRHLLPRRYRPELGAPRPK